MIIGDNKFGLLAFAENKYFKCARLHLLKCLSTWEGGKLSAHQSPGETQIPDEYSSNGKAEH